MSTSRTEQEGLAAFAAAGFFRRYRAPSRLTRWRSSLIASHVLQEVQPGGNDPPDRAVVRALTRGAAVHVVEPRMPRHAPGAVIFRY